MTKPLQFTAGSALSTTDPIGTAQELIEVIRDALWEYIQGTALDVSPDDAEDLARAALSTPALQSRIAEVEQMMAALPIFERVTRLAHNLASDVPITAAARKHIQAAYDELAALSLHRRPT